MKILVLGAGVIGVTTAYVLATQGHEVEVVERQEEAGRETSYANGGQLSYSHAEPWANPSVFNYLPQWLFKSDAPLVFRPRADLAMINWGLRFLASCAKDVSQANSVHILRLGLYSKKKTEQIRVHSGVQFDNVREGILHVFSDPKSFEAAKLQSKFQEKFGCKEDVLTPEQCLRMEPALEHVGRTLIGGVHAPLDESGDCLAFTQQLAQVCVKDHKVQFRYGTTIQAIESSKGKITKVKTDKGDLTADAYVMAMGSYAPLFLKKLGIKVPIYPMKGYSITLPANIYTPKVSITDSEHKLVYSRLGNRLRIAGTAEFAGYNTDINDRRIQPILKQAKGLFPKCDFDGEMTTWGCLRPSTPDGPPILGKCKVENLYLNVGHGTLGWTHAAGSAVLVADVIDGRQTEITLNGLTVDRY